MSIAIWKIQFILGLGICIATCWPSSIAYAQRRDSTRIKSDTTRGRSINPYMPSYRPSDRHGDPFSNYTTLSPLYLQDPKSKNVDVQIDTGMNYTIQEKIGKVNFRPNSTMTFNEFINQQDLLFKKNYWQSKSLALDGESAVSSRNLIPKLYVSPILDRIFGGSYVELVPRGFVTLDFGANFQRIQNPSIPIRQQRNGGFVFDQQINLNVTGKVGEKLKITTNFDTNNSFDFQNNMKIEYTGFKEDVLKKLELGNVSLPLNNTLIKGSSNLFGIKAQMQFGKMYVTALASTQRGKQSTIKVSGSSNGAAQGKPFEIVGSNYDDNRHFFLAQFFRDNFEKWLKTIPQITSGINITRLEVYSINRQNDTQSQRNTLAFMDMGESDKIYNSDKSMIKAKGSGLPAYNDANDLFTKLASIPGPADQASQWLLDHLNLVSGTDFDLVTSARKLASTEYTFNAQLGYLTLQRKLQNDESLAVAFEYTYNGKVYKVGELTEDYSTKPADQAIFLKMLRPRKINIKDQLGNIYPTWNLMMKNIYSLGVTNLTKDGFQLRVIYRDDRTGLDNPQLQDGVVSRQKQLIQVMGLDQLNPYNDPQPDGNFDYVEKVTINSDIGLIIFPYLEPLNKPLRQLFALENNNDLNNYLVNKYVYDTLYHTTLAEAALVTTKNKFYISGTFKSGSGRDIIIQGFNISQGSVKVYSGGTPLREGVDYTVDYTFGKVTILNDGILNSGKDIDITYEQQDPFAFQTRSLLGTRLDYKLSDEVNIGSTFLYYNERPLITRNLIGSEPARNVQYGFDFNMKKNSRVLTKMVDALPFLQTKEQSTVTLTGEFAQLLPGTSNTINGDGTSFIDDFENSATPYSLINPQSWKLASAPSNDHTIDLSNGALDNVKAGYRRAKLAWYSIDNLFYTQSYSYKPSNITSKDLENHYVRPIIPQEIFPYKDAYVGNFYEPIFNIAYYPSERGQYNYNPDLNSDGTLKNPANNWGGITTAIRTEVDFDKANIEYIEFWMMNPFINKENGKIDDGRNPPQSNTTGGKLVFHVGSVSEDLMRDEKHAFENGLPTDGNLSSTNVTSNNWGYVTNQQYLNNAFDNSTTSRPNQDVGLDGMNSLNEQNYFQNFINSVNGNAQPIIKADPSADDFGYFLGGDLDAKNAKILERYKNINGMENNSPVLTGNEPYAKSGTTVPDNEDLNQDNTLSDLEEYYSYSVDLKPGMTVGDKYIVDQISPAAYNNDVTWYLFRIPIRQFDAKVGDITDFKSIKYIRMYLTGFTQPVVLRLSSFRSVGQRWRQYTGTLQEATFAQPIEPDLDNFTVSTVNVEENGQPDAQKPGYVEPLKRDRDVTSVVQRRLNEQSAQLCVTGLPDGDARAMYKNVSMDLFNYHRIKMFISAHGPVVKDNQVKAFLRLGTDFDQNYYEIELPLKMSPPNERNVDDVWPLQNQIDLDLNELYSLKVRRDRENFSLTVPYPLGGAFTTTDGKHGIRIMGRPDLSQLKTIMIGVRNPRSDDHANFDVCIWADELRLTDFDRTAGWASNMVLNTKLADLGTINTSFKHIGFGYGDVQSKISERSRSNTNTFDLSANINVDKLLPRNSGLKIPMFVSYESIIADPKFDPANPDVRIAAALQSFDTDAERQSYLKIIQDRTIKKSINFTNVRKVKVDKNAASHIYDIENFAFTYAYSESNQTNFSLAQNTLRNVKGGATWQYASKFKGFEPFKKSKGLSSKSFQLIKDFNFNPLPSNVSVRSELVRSFSKIAYRNSIKDNSPPSAANFMKYFTFNRYYNLRWAFTKALTLDYNSTANAIIDEPDGDITSANRSVIINNLKKGGRMKYFEQNITANYTLPLDKFPLTNFLGAEYRYNVGYNWKAGPLEKADSLKLGNIIQNMTNQGFTGKIDVVKLYNKIGFLRGINTPPKPIPPPSKATPNVRKPVPRDTVPKPPDLKLVKGLLRLIMSLRNITGTYTVSRGTILPGFTPSPHLFGMDQNWNAPGWGFILGQQDPNMAVKAGQNGWLTKSTSLTTPFTQNVTRDISIKANLEPSNDMKIQLDFKRSNTDGFQEIYRMDSAGNYNALSPTRSGTYKVSIISIATAFRNNQSINSSVFQTFENNIGTIKERFNTLIGKKDGYQDQSQDVLIPAFLSAYTGKSANTASLSPFPKLPMPNWRLDYSGLSKIEALKDVFQSITLSHAYSSSYSVTNYTNSLEYSDSYLSVNNSITNYNVSHFADTTTIKNSTTGNIVPVYVIGQVMISEQFAPLIGITAKTKTKLSITLAYKTKRDLALNVSNAQVTEVNGKDWSFELGYTKNNMKLPFKDQGRTITLKNDITFRMTMGVTSNQTIQRKINDVNTVTAGNINFQLRPNVSYVVNQKLNIQAYVERTTNTPLVSNSYRRSTTQVGFKLLFNLAQ